jgi:hypothetical protein
MKLKNIILILLATLGYKPTKAQVNLQTGSASYNIPIFNWQDTKSRLNLNVALNYNSGNGLKVDEIASNVGTGWNLLAGGVISRMQVGQPDDQKPKEGLYNDFTKYPPGYLYNPRAGNNECPKGLTRYPVFAKEITDVKYKQHNAVLADRELDYFVFRFNGREGQFILNKANANQCFSIGDSKLKISYEIDENKAANENCRTTIMGFKIIDENGVIPIIHIKQPSLYGQKYS